MSKVLSQEEIDALLSSVTEGKEAEEAEKEAVQKTEEREVSLYDFKRPHLISKEQERLLHNIHENIVRKLAVFLSAQLRMIVDMDLIGIDQIMYSEFVMSITSPAALYVGEFDDPYSQFILEVSPQLVALTVERMFGGQGTYAPSDHKVTSIEQKIMARIVDKISDEITENWKTVREFECEFTEFETNPEFVQIVSASEPVIVASIEIKVRGNTYMINICYPYVWISEILSDPEVQQKMMYGSEQVSEDQSEIVKSNLNDTNLDLRAILGKSTITVEDVVNLQEGDVIKLDTRPGEEIPVYAKEKKIFRANVGTKKDRYAIKISETMERD